MTKFLKKAFRPGARLKLFTATLPLMLARGLSATAETTAAPDSEFLQAVAAGDLARVHSALDRGANVNAKGLNGYFALEEAIDQAKTNLANFLLDHGADVNLRDDFGTTALIAAAKNGRAEVIEPLLARHADIHATHDGAIVAAVANGDALLTARLLSVGSDPNAKDEAGRTLVMLGIHSPELTKLLLAHGATLAPNAADNQGVTLLMHAAAESTLDTVKLLLAEGGDLAARDHDGHTLLMNLPLNPLGDSPAALEGMIAFLVARGVDVNARDHTGATALHHAVHVRLTAFGGTMAHASIVRALLAAGADPNLADGDNQTPLMLATASASGTSPERAAELNKIISLLRQAGARNQPVAIGRPRSIFSNSPIDHNLRPQPP